MASLNADHGRLRVRFTWLGVRCQEHLGLPDTRESRAIARRKVRVLEGALAGGTFVYAEHFPKSRRAGDERAAQPAPAAAIVLDRRKPPPRHVVTYFLLDEERRRIKIGRSTNLAARVRTIEASSGIRLRVLGILQGDVEQEWHSGFIDARLLGEWFTVTSHVAHRLREALGCHVDAAHDETRPRTPAP